MLGGVLGRLLLRVEGNAPMRAGEDEEEGEKGGGAEPPPTPPPIIVKHVFSGVRHFYFLQVIEIENGGEDTNADTGAAPGGEKWTSTLKEGGGEGS